MFYAITQLPPRQSAKVMLAVGVILTLFFGSRLVRSKKIMPAGIMTVLRYCHLLGSVDLVHMRFSIILKCWESFNVYNVVFRTINVYVENRERESSILSFAALGRLGQGNPRFFNYLCMYICSAVILNHPLQVSPRQRSGP